jgi:hypothetical protein
LGCDEIAGAPGTLGAGHGGAQARGRGAAVRARQLAMERQGQAHRVRRAARGAALRRQRQPAAVPGDAGACALQGAARGGRGSDRWQAPADRAVGRADAAAVPGAGHGAAQEGRGTPGDSVARHTPAHHGPAGCVLAQGAARARQSPVAPARPISGSATHCSTVPTRAPRSLPGRRARAGAARSRAR